MHDDDLSETPALASAGAEVAVSAGDATDTTGVQLALSHSQVEAFGQCPRRWWLLKRAGVRRAPSEALILGLAAHAAIESDLSLRFARDGRPVDAPSDSDSPSAPSAPSASSPVPPAVRAAVSSDPSAANRSAAPSPSGVGARHASSAGGEDPLTDAFAALFAEEDPTGLIVPERRELLHAQGRAVLRAYAEGVAPHMRPVEVEREFAFPHPGDPSILFTGRIDAVTQPDHGTQERTIVDWKVPRRAWAWGEEDRRIQAAAYLWAEAQMDWERSERFTFITFPPADPVAAQSGDEAGPRTVDARPTKRNARQLDAYARLVRDTAARIRAWEPWGEEGFPTRTSGLCPWCEVRGACAEGQRYVRRRGLTPRIPELPPDVAGT